MCCSEEAPAPPRERFYIRWPRALKNKAVQGAKLGAIALAGLSAAGSLLLVLDVALLGRAGRRRS